MYTHTSIPYYWYSRYIQILYSPVPNHEMKWKDDSESSHFLNHLVRPDNISKLNTLIISGGFLRVDTRSCRPRRHLPPGWELNSLSASSRWSTHTHDPFSVLRSYRWSRCRRSHDRSSDRRWDCAEHRRTLLCMSIHRSVPDVLVGGTKDVSLRFG